jgi:hypothetical protein
LIRLNSPRLIRVAAATLISFVILALPLWFIGNIIVAKLNLGGVDPNLQTIGSVNFLEQRAMEQFCTGVAVTPQSTWLVGRIEVTDGYDARKSGAVDLDALAYGSAPPTHERRLGDPPYPLLTYISRLDEHGRFRLIATVGESACLQPSPDGRTVYLLTGLERPKDDAGNHDPSYENDVPQLLVFRSDDQGKSWVWQREGFMSHAAAIAWSLKPYFHGNKEVWAWGNAAGAADELFYSADGGISSVRVPHDASLLLSVDQVRSKAPEDAMWQDADSAPYGSITAHIIQFDSQRAVLWASQSFSFSSKSTSGEVFSTSYAEIKREGNIWHIGPARRLADTQIEQLLENAEGRVIAVINHAGDQRKHIAELDRTTLEWKSHGDLPTAFGRLDASDYINGLWIGRSTLVTTVQSSLGVPHESSRISADATFYSNDWGRSWQRLAIGDSLDVLGLAPQNDRVFWTRGNWYDDRKDSKIYGYNLM